jgi:replicative DNA helicase
MLRNGHGAAEVAGELRESDFRSDPHRRVFVCIQALVERGEPVNLVAVAEEMTRRGRLPELGDAPYAYLAALHEAEPVGANLAADAVRVRELALLRRVGQAGRDVVALADHPAARAEETLDEAERLIFAVCEERLALADAERHFADVVSEVYDRLDQRERSGGNCGAVRTGLGALDNILAGLQPSELTIVAARPSLGKTTFGLAVATDAALRQGVPVLFVSLEQPGAELGERALCGLGGVDSHVVRQALLSASERASFTAAGDRLRAAQMFVSDLPGQRMARIAARARRRKAKGQLGLLVIDYLQLIEPDNRRDPRHEQVAQISRRLKLLARELKVPVVVMAQLNRESEHRTDRRPRLADLRESGSIEADADVVLLLHRPDPHKPDLEVIVAKNRNGPVGEVVLRHDRKTGRISDPAEPLRADAR